MSGDFPGLTISRSAWRRIHRDLSRRGQGQRESAAFLLGRPGCSRVRAWVAYDDLDPDCLTGGISFSGHCFADLWALCRAHRLSVVADLHTHPGRQVEQSAIDMATPTIARAGHISLITPSFAQPVPRIDQVGVHVYQGDGQWLSIPASRRRRVLRLRLSWWRTTRVSPRKSGQSLRTAP